MCAKEFDQEILIAKIVVVDMTTDLPWRCRLRSSRVLRDHFLSTNG